MIPRPDVEQLYDEYVKNGDLESANLCKYIQFLETRMAGIKVGLREAVQDAEPCPDSPFDVIVRMRFSTEFYCALTGNEAPRPRIQLVTG